MLQKYRISISNKPGRLLNLATSFPLLTTAIIAGNKLECRLEIIDKLFFNFIQSAHARCVF